MPDAIQINTQPPDQVVITADDPPQIVIQEQAADVVLLSTETVVLGPKGDKGDPGVSDFVGTFVAGQPILQGQPVYISRQNRLLMVADSSTYLSAFVIGFAVVDIPTGYAGDVKKGVLNFPDWTALTGGAYLQPGFPYFLNGCGTLSYVPPTSGGYIAIGEALTEYQLLFKPSFPIQL